MSTQTHTASHRRLSCPLATPDQSLFIEKRSGTSIHLLIIFSLCRRAMPLCLVVLPYPSRPCSKVILWSDLSRPHSYHILTYSCNSFYVGSFTLMLVISQSLPVPALSTSGWSQSSPLESSSWHQSTSSSY